MRLNVVGYEVKNRLAAFNDAAGYSRSVVVGSETQITGHVDEFELAGYLYELRLSGITSTEKHEFVRRWLLENGADYRHRIETLISHAERRILFTFVLNTAEFVLVTGGSGGMSLERKAPLVMEVKPVAKILHGKRRLGI
jgi:hypothetical protein